MRVCAQTGHGALAAVRGAVRADLAAASGAARGRGVRGAQGALAARALHRHLREYRRPTSDLPLTYL